MAKQTKPDKSILLAEYGEAGNAMRAHADTRWKLLSVVVTISGGILLLSAPFPHLESSMNFFGLFTACLFAFIEYRTQLTWKIFFHRAVEIEKQLGITGAYSNMNLEKRAWYRMNSTSGIQVGYTALIAYWICAALTSLA